MYVPARFGLNDPTHITTPDPSTLSVQLAPGSTNDVPAFIVINPEPFRVTTGAIGSITSTIRLIVVVLRLLSVIA